MMWKMDHVKEQFAISSVELWQGTFMPPQRIMDGSALRQVGFICMGIIRSGMVGLTDEAAEAMVKNSKDTQAKSFNAASKRGEERRWLYAKNWKEWPEEVTIEDGMMDDCDVNLGGKYVRVGCLHTFNQNACWIRRRTDSAPELYFLIKPDVSYILMYVRPNLMSLECYVV
eukprot:scaffold4016_cov116-Skeletonema_menzelii.AAC.5